MHVIKATVKNTKDECSGVGGMGGGLGGGIRMSNSDAIRRSLFLRPQILYLIVQHGSFIHRTSKNRRKNTSIACGKKLNLGYLGKCFANIKCLKTWLIKEI